LLAHLVEQGIFEMVTLKGGTALRKLFAGAQGRFSTDLDLAATEVGVDRHALAAMVADACRVTLGPFTFLPNDDRNRWQIAVNSEYGSPDFRIKLDVGPPCWVTREYRTFVTTPIHARYGFSLPRLPSMRLEEILAEKIARLSRTATARDASDLVWAARTSPHSQFNREGVRRLAMLKVWVDNNGLQPAWHSALACAPFKADTWLATRRDWDDEQIGMLASPPPSLADLEAGLRTHYCWLANLSAEELGWARAESHNRGEVLTAVRTLREGALRDAHIY
ncbi:MAG: nucleotidyl transferase AbiEii/AbiGii toxin family protein, partial [Gemmatimonadota bacterium]|nr:nucleotidyl transferase AbiEii/AbiGii toxin family protein [Gemmatimonadota bacterium]